MAMNLFITVSWDVILCSLLESNHCFDGALKMETPDSSEPLIPFYQTTRYDIPEDCNLLFS
jgi:hypothetical protein